MRLKCVQNLELKVAGRFQLTTCSWLASRRITQRSPAQKDHIFRSIKRSRLIDRAKIRPLINEEVAKRETEKRERESAIAWWSSLLSVCENRGWRPN